MRFKVMMRRLYYERLAFLSLIYLLLLILLSIIAPFIVPFDPEAQDLNNIMAAPNSHHWFGTDELGRDIFTRILLGGQAAIQAGLIGIMIPLLVGVPLGVISGYMGGIVDDIFMRVVDAILSFPAILLALAITGALGVSLWNAMIAIGIIFTPQFARLARGQTLQVRREPYVEAAKISGSGPFWIMVRHIFPNIASPIIVQASFSFSLAILVEASLSFLGMGAQSPQISWGGMLHQAYSMIFVNPLMMLFPGIAILLSVLAGNFLGDGLRIAIDPRMKRT
ncbi:peptide/nickel transport system permease protein [Cytobacillus horneckiae]|uniref:ABC transporter permease n=1 Tax=Cytobacillus horneckiae TaxID=549687 RepID=A0A2N0ZA53_9BACI|nr:ABC transporter permease [Cytobacillus horneckiae]NRG45592.1 ABC transporter permease [Bacillus sp. CRN 9]MBN6885481.1 ABC transporter permease [Cytobacillus horneckiae]MCM3178793.1 ABC transporter permease [Cytobacillus horneckiae]MEC1158792.1 ABC transporter permease [Cytobacillus horneckiae]MED2937315.1 ABC transporter permease [Cytobacillus horneckiae]